MKSGVGIANIFRRQRKEETAEGAIGHLSAKHVEEVEEGAWLPVVSAIFSGSTFQPQDLRRSFATDSMKRGSPAGGS